MMSHLPEPVADTDIQDMFEMADRNKDGRISWEEFLVMIQKNNNISVFGNRVAEKK